MYEPALRIRPAAVAGMFYAADSQQLESDVLSYLHLSKSAIKGIPKAIIAPHAGYIYSGPVAASAYSLLKPYADQIKQVILLGPAHRVAVQGIATPDMDYFETPLGQVKINQTLCQKIERLNFVHGNSLAHSQEHSLEVHLPFLQTVLTDFELTPLVVGDCNRQDVAQLLELLWGDSQTLIVVSTDLSHFHDYNTALKLDQQTSQAIQQLQPDKILYDNACGRNPLNGLLTLAQKKHLTVDLLDLRNSGDTAGDKDRVVGYGAYVVH